MTIAYLWLMSMILQPRPLTEAVHKAKVPLILFVCWLGYLFLQTVPLPANLLGFINPAGYDFYNYTLGEQQNLPITQDQGVSYIELMKSIAYVTVFFLTLCLINTRNRLKVIVWTLFLTGFAQALYAILSIKGIVFWNPSPESVSGSYVNRNHLAGLLEMTIPLGIGLFFYKMRRSRSSDDWKQKVRNLSAFIMEREVQILVMCAVMFGVLLMTTSRGGTFSLLVAFLLVGLYTRFKLRSSREAKLLPWVLGLALISSIWFGVEDLTSKITKHGIDEQRLKVASISINMTQAYPLVGVGNGLWEESFSQYRNDSAGSGRFEHAHNDYLETLVGQGLLGFVLLSAAVLLVLINLIVVFGVKREPLAKGVLFGVLVGLVSILVHGMMDFNLHIPGNMLVLMGVLASGVAAEQTR